MTSKVLQAVYFTFVSRAEATTQKEFMLNKSSLGSFLEQTISLCEKLILISEKIKNKDHNKRSDIVQINTPSQHQALSVIFSELDSLSKKITHNKAIKILQHQKIINLAPIIRRLRAEYEFKQEMVWAKSILDQNNPANTIKNLLRMEYEGSSLYSLSLQTVLKSVGKSCLVVGSGPLPTTALMLDNILGLKVTCLDSAKESGKFSQQIFNAVQLSYPVEHITSDIQNITEFSDYDIIFVNGLVGVSRTEDYIVGKEAVIEHFQKHIKHPCILIIRTGYGLSTLFYPPVSFDRFESGTTEVIHPTKLGRSSLIIYRKNVISSK